MVINLFTYIMFIIVMVMSCDIVSYIICMFYFLCLIARDMDTTCIINVYIHAYIYICKHMYMYVYTYMYTYIYVYTHIQLLNPWKKICIEM